MQVNDLWNLLSCHGPHETVVVDATGLKIGRHGHIDVPLDPHMGEAEFEVVKNGCGEVTGRRALRVDL